MYFFRVIQSLIVLNRCLLSNRPTRVAVDIKLSKVTESVLCVLDAGYSHDPISVELSETFSLIFMHCPFFGTECTTSSITWMQME